MTEAPSCLREWPKKMSPNYRLPPTIGVLGNLGFHWVLPIELQAPPPGYQNIFLGAEPPAFKSPMTSTRLLPELPGCTWGVEVILRLNVLDVQRGDEGRAPQTRKANPHGTRP